MAHFTWEDLGNKIKEMNEDQLATDVSVYDQDADEFYCVEGIGIAEEDVLEEGDPYIIFPLNSDMEAMREEKLK